METTTKQVAVKGRIVEIFAKKEGTWDAMRALLLDGIVATQGEGGITCYVDTGIVAERKDLQDRTLDLAEARDRGVDCARMLLSLPDDMRQAMDVAEALVRSGELQLVVMGPLPHKTRLPEVWQRKVSALARQTQCALVFARL